MSSTTSRSERQAMPRLRTRADDPLSSRPSAPTDVKTDAAEQRAPCADGCEMHLARACEPRT
eukprot:1584467-Pleurochrysis_carterae.AAC.1